jgi:signal transduction histidine kinase
VSPELATVHVDPFRLEQAIENLVTNALRYTPDGGSIELRARQTASSVAIEVRDSGAGIPPEHLPFIFDRFYKAAAADGLASPGSGLGLSIVKAIVTRHGGRVSAASEVGRGTTITLELPARHAGSPDRAA